jgi:hypothetical protein
MDKLTVITNNVPRPLFCLHELPASVQKDFDYAVGYQSPRFVQYKDVWYDAEDTQRISLSGRQGASPVGWAVTVANDSPLAGWHSILSETFFSGVLFRFVDYERVIVGRYFA